MPIYSMTGFARTQVRVHDQLAYTLSLKSVNHRFLDIQLRLPAGFDALEMDLRRVLKESLVRGHVELTLSVDRTAQQRAGYNRDLVAGYIDAFKQARAEFRMKGEPDLNIALRIPGALQAEIRNNSEEDVAALTESAMREIGPLLEELKVMRAREGESLEAILRASLVRLAGRLDRDRPGRVRVHAPTDNVQDVVAAIPDEASPEIHHPAEVEVQVLGIVRPPARRAAPLLQPGYPESRRSGAATRASPPDSRKGPSCSGPATEAACDRP